MALLEYIRAKESLYNFEGNQYVIIGLVYPWKRAWKLQNTLLNLNR